MSRGKGEEESTTAGTSISNANLDDEDIKLKVIPEEEPSIVMNESKTSIGAIECLSN